MPLVLKEPRPGKSPNYSIRGTYLGVYIDRTAGTPNETKARQILAAIKRDIERGRITSAVEKEEPAERTFGDAALAYIKSGGEAKYLGTFDAKTDTWLDGVISKLEHEPLSRINQQKIDECAVSLYPLASSQTRNRHVYTPISAVLKHAGLDFKIRRPKGWRGKARVAWLQPDQAFRMFEAARKEDPEFAGLLVFLCYTGCRLNEALALTCDKLLLSEAFAYLPQTKNEDPRGVHLPPVIVTELANHPRGLDRGREKVFRFRKCGRLYTLMGRVKTATGPDVEHITFHTFCHTWATWMRRYAGMDTRGLIGTGRWRDQQSVARYEHVVASEESRRADLLPTPKKSKIVGNVENPGNGGKGKQKARR